MFFSFPWRFRYNLWGAGPPMNGNHYGRRFADHCYGTNLSGKSLTPSACMLETGTHTG